jgi:ribosomal protein L37E
MNERTEVFYVTSDSSLWLRVNVPHGLITPPTIELHKPMAGPVVFYHASSYKLRLPADVEGAFTCPRCGMTSYNPDDIDQGYCGNCRVHRGHARVPGARAYEGQAGQRSGLHLHGLGLPWLGRRGLRLPGTAPGVGPAGLGDGVAVQHPVPGLNGV